MPWLALGSGKSPDSLQSEAMCCPVHGSQFLAGVAPGLRRFVLYGLAMLAGLRWFWGFRGVDKLDSK